MWILEKKSDSFQEMQTISKAAFGLTPGEYKKLKGLKQQNLKNHMNNLELIFASQQKLCTLLVCNPRFYVP